VVTIQADILGKNGTSQTQSGTVQIVRPPLALIHGIWSNHTTWDFFAPLVLPNGYDPRFQVLRVDYKGHNGDHIDNIIKSSDGSSPFDQLPEYLTLFKEQQNVAAVQFDVVGHSMGGLVTRDMALDPRFKAVENYNQGMVHKLITIGSPHNGSPLVNQLNTSSPLCKAALGTQGDLVAGAVEDLSVGSVFLAKVNGLQAATTLPLKAHAIVGIANATQQAASTAAINLVTTFVCKNLTPLITNSDLIVPQDSQSFGFVPATTVETVSDAIHTVILLVFQLGPDELNRVLSGKTPMLNPVPSSDPTIDPNRVINGLNTPISDTNYWADIKP
jgi:pimeloyl-ACP methyl ester carboxylesterase